MRTNNKVLIIGAGVIGVTTAEAFHSLGYDVTVLEANPQAGIGVSKANGGQLCPAFCLPFNAPNFWLKLLQLPSNKNGTGFRLIDGVKNINWASKFIFNSSKTNYQNNSAKMMAIAKYADQSLNEICTKYDLAFDHNKGCGKLYLYDSVAPLSAWSQLYDLRSSYGFDIQVLNVSQCIEKEPILAQSTINFAGGLFVQDTSVGDCSLFTHDLSTKLSALGVQFYYSTKANKLVFEDDQIIGVESSDGKTFAADMVVLTSALGTLNLLPKSIVKNYPMAPFKGYSHTIPLINPGPVGTITDASRVVAMSVLGDKLRVSGGVFLDSSPDLNQAQLQRILDLAKRYLPEIADYDGETMPWTGHRPTTPSSVPYIEQTKIDGLYINAGHGSHGWSLAASSAQILMALVQQTNQ